MTKNGFKYSYEAYKKITTKAFAEKIECMLSTI
jgi:hypothetical protein